MQTLTTREDIQAIFGTSVSGKSAVQYLERFPGQAAESAFFVLAQAILISPAAPHDLKDMASCLIDKLEPML
jgi:hypothetical protein